MPEDKTCPRCGSERWRNIGGELGWWECGDCKHYRWVTAEDVDVPENNDV
jgi:hypothetical protein